MNQEIRERTKWFMDARFGMFIHWGLYSIPACGEWVMSEREMTVEEYRPYFEQFDPVDYDPKKWVRLAKEAGMSGVKRMVLISTDKAVNPTNFMGATKRFCEMILQSRTDSPTEFCAVRFGNVLGSNGSVVPLFKKQIQEGGPVTITDRRIIRYFMTIPEAAQLVLEAGAMAKRSEIFVLDMGEPVKILELAENLIRLSGLELDKDITIQEIGLRPGEKLYEELLMRSGTLSKTSNEKIFIEQQQDISKDVIMDDLLRLDEAVTRDIPPQDLITMLREMVPTYTSPEEINGRATAEVS